MLAIIHFLKVMKIQKLLRLIQIRKLLGGYLDWRAVKLTTVLVGKYYPGFQDDWHLNRSRKLRNHLLDILFLPGSRLCEFHDCGLFVEVLILGGCKFHEKTPEATAMATRRVLEFVRFPYLLISILWHFHVFAYVSGLQIFRNSHSFISPHLHMFIFS